MQLIGLDYKELRNNASMVQFLSYVAALESIVGSVAVRKEVAVPGVGKALEVELLEPEELSTAAQIGPHLDLIKFAGNIVLDDWSTHFDLSCDLLIKKGPG
jgi:hypothetical protein